LRRQGDEDVVYLVRDDVVAATPVVVDAIGDDLAAVTGDVAVDDVVVVSGIESVEDGEPVPS
jgi:hypothetical protein